MTVTLTRIAAAIFAASAFSAVAAPQAMAIDAFWQGQRSQLWGDGSNGATSNWYDQAPLNGNPVGVPNGTAIFSTGALQTAPVVQGKHSIGRVLFEAGTTTQYNVTVFPNSKLIVRGKGVTNNSTQDQLFSTGTRKSKLIFRKSAVVGDVAGGGKDVSIVNGNRGETIFEDRALGIFASIYNLQRGYLTFKDRSSAGGMNLFNNGAKSVITFLDKSNGNVTVISNTNGTVSLEKNKSRIFKLSNLDNSARIKFGRKKVRIKKDFAMLPGSNISIYVYANDSKSGNVNAQERLFVDGTLRIYGPANWPANKNYKLMQGELGRHGKFKSVKFIGFPKSVKPRLVYDGKSVYIKSGN